MNGLTGDAWTPLDTEGAKALTITADGFHYKLVSELMFGGKYQPPAAHTYTQAQSGAGNRLVFIAQGMTRGQGKTEGYHERRVPISPKARGLLASNQKEPLARLSAQRIAVIGEVRKLLWLALAVLFSSGKSGDNSDATKAKASTFAAPFERTEDARFFDDLNAELEAAAAAAERLQWMLDLVGRADAVLQTAFAAGPRNGIQKYKAQSTALSRFHGGLRSDNSPLPELAHHYRQQAALRSMTSTHAPTEEPPLDYA